MKGNGMEQSLWEISKEMQRFDEVLSETDDFDSPEVQDALEQWKKNIKENLSNKADNYAAFIKVLEGRSQLRQAEADRMSARARVDKNIARRLKDFLKLVFDMHKIQRIETNRFRLTVAKSGGKQGILVDCEATDLPEEYQIKQVTFKADTDAIRVKLESGEVVEHCSLKERGTSLRIK